ncbi:helix-turn-helix domain-containing protein [Methylibium petroleiphilum]|uniref:helix-turn-helix domain-containing protein n=1 Tax=Methylibium petroleiphilum TaxID=105560 RepID=UPI003D28E21E
MNGADFTGPTESERARQRQLVLAALRVGPLSSVEGRERLGVLSPAARVMELRRAGHHIVTIRGNRLDEHGRRHLCGVYVLTEGTSDEP